MMDPVSAVSVAAGAAQLVELAANVISHLFKYCRAVKKAPKFSRELREEASLVYKVLEDLDSTLETSNTPTTYTFNDIVQGLLIQ
jgi:hypothetical protein